MNERTKLLKEIQQLNFAMIDAGLYLNTQPDTPEAVALFEKYQQLHKEAKKAYEDAYGPLCYEGIHAGQDGWSWLNGPWPWEGEC